VKKAEKVVVVAVVGAVVEFVFVTVHTFSQADEAWISILRALLHPLVDALLSHAWTIECLCGCVTE